MRAFLIRSRLKLLTLLAGGGLLVLQGCDPTVRDTVLNGVGSAAPSLVTTVIQAFIQSLLNQNQTPTPTTVQAVLENLPKFFA